MYMRHQPLVMVPRHRWVPTVSPVTMSGFADDTPGLSPYPWTIDQAEAAPQGVNWERVATVVAAIGGVIGLLATFGVIRTRY